MGGIGTVKEGGAEGLCLCRDGTLLQGSDGGHQAGVGEDLALLQVDAIGGEGELEGEGPEVTAIRGLVGMAQDKGGVSGHEMKAASGAGPMEHTVLEMSTRMLRG